VNTLYDLFIHELKDLYSAADEMYKVLKRMSSSATNPVIVEMLDTYYTQVQYQKEKLEEFFASKSIDVDKADCPIMEKLSHHGLGSMRYEGSKEIRDIALLITVNIMKHFEVTAFGTALTHAERLKEDNIADMLLSLKNKIAEEKQKPAAIASKILKDGASDELKKEVKQLLGSMLKAQVSDEERLSSFLTEIGPKANSNRLKEALESYRSEHEDVRKQLADFLSENIPSIDIDQWSVMDGFISEWEEHLSSVRSDDLKDIGFILSVQRIQHHNMALFEFQRLLTGFIEHPEMQGRLEYLLKQEEGNDVSFTAIAEGSLFQEGLDAKIKPGG